jgi:hypothetical protein
MKPWGHCQSLTSMTSLVMGIQFWGAGTKSGTRGSWWCVGETLRWFFKSEMRVKDIYLSSQMQTGSVSVNLHCQQADLFCTAVCQFGPTLSSMHGKLVCSVSLPGRKCLRLWNSTSCCAKPGPQRYRFGWAKITTLFYRFYRISVSKRNTQCIFFSSFRQWRPLELCSSCRDLLEEGNVGPQVACVGQNTVPPCSTPCADCNMLECRFIGCEGRLDYMHILLCHVYISIYIYLLYIYSGSDRSRWIQIDHDVSWHNMTHLADLRLKMAHLTLQVDLIFGHTGLYPALKYPGQRTQSS